MLTLAVETATRKLGVSLTSEDEIVGMYELMLTGYPHGEHLAEAVDRLLTDAGLETESLELLAVDIGPGSFTGLRIGVAFIKSLALSLGLPTVGVSSLDVLAASVADSGRPVCPVLDAKRGNVYAGRYREGQREMDPVLVTPADFLRNLDEEALFLGDACEVYARQFEQAGQILPPESWYPSSLTLGRLARRSYAAAGGVKPSDLVPLYLYPMDCSVRKEPEAK